MGKRRFAVTAQSDEWKHDYSHFGNSMITHTRGWNSGVEVLCSVEDGEDVFRIYATSGSNGGNRRRLIGALYGDRIVAGKEIVG